VDKDRNAVLKGEGEAPLINAAKIEGMDITDIQLPNYVEDYPMACANLNSLTVEEGITSLKGFRYANITTLTLPDSLTTIEDYDADDGDDGYENGAFGGCTQLARIHFGSGLTYIGNYAFQDCQKLQALVLPEGVTKIGMNIYPTTLVRVRFPDSLKDYSTMPATMADTLEECWVGKNMPDKTMFFQFYGKLCYVLNRSDSAIYCDGNDEFEQYDGEVPWVWVKDSSEDYGNIGAGHNHRSGLTYSIKYNLDGGARLFGNNTTSYEYGKTTKLPEATYKDQCFGGWKTSTGDVCVTELSLNNKIQGDITLTPIFEDITVKAGKGKLQMMINESKYSLLGNSYMYAFLYSTTEDMSNAQFKLTSQYADAEDIDAGTYYYQVRIIPIMDASDALDDHPTTMDELSPYLADVVLLEGSADVTE